MTRATLIHRAQLIDAMTGAHRWAERYDRKLEGVFANRSRRSPVRLSYEYIASVLPELDPRLAQPGSSSRISETVPASAR